jgi:hypothetical protein
MPREAGSGGAAVDQHRLICRYRKAKNSKDPRRSESARTGKLLGTNAEDLPSSATGGNTSRHVADDRSIGLRPRRE